ncbi:cellulose biosynthesis protein BcsN [Neorhizobium huautlense]|uniref:cellulose biosynthesis protein BcsN n=1 Tax=Neorhizobium huautlense TaxID=67774 RepID=UPI0013003979|nr:cellulose biosynthesis protein BcsN [Neorhizobium huautlense]
MTGLGSLRAAILSFLLPLVAVGCAGQPVQTGTFARNLSSEQAMALPPPGGPAIVSVVERRFDNAVEQDVFLATSALTPGQNSIKAQFFGTTSPFKLSDNKLTSTPVTEAGIASEMRRALPGIRMARSSFFVQNNYGPFGYAFGRGARSDLCMYAWQQIRSPSGTISPLANYGSIQIRLRLCQAGGTEEQLLAVMYNYTIVGSVDAGGWNPYGEPRSVPSSLGGVGAPIYPRPASSEPIVPIIQPRTTTYTSSAPVTLPQAQSVTRKTGSVVSASAVSVPGPASAGSRPNSVSTPAVSNAIPAPLVPSPSAAMGAREVTIPSPSCTDMTSGAANACR